MGSRRSKSRPGKGTPRKTATPTRDLASAEIARDDAPESERRARPGGRSQRVVAEVLRATTAELARVGYVALRIDDVARRADVNKTTVYRRWPTKPELVSAAVRFLRGDSAVVPDEGAIAKDLLALVEAWTERATTLEGRGVLRMIMLEFEHPEVTAICSQLRDENRAAWVAVVTRAIRRGELRRDTDAALLVEMIISTVSTRLFRTREPVDRTFFRRLVSLALQGASVQKKTSAG